MGKPLRWSGLKDPPDYDLCLKRPEGYWDIIHGVDGWVIYSPVHIDDSVVTETNRFRRVLGDVTRDEAREVAEAAIRKMRR